MPHRDTERAVAEAAPLDTAREAAGAAAASAPAAVVGGSVPGAGSADPIAGELRRAGLLPLLVLHLLASGPSYGNQLIEQISELTGGLLSVNPNTMYPLLRALEQQGLAEGAWEHPQRRSRRFYTITPAGRAERERLRGEIAPRLDVIADSIERLRREVVAP